jgi:hypothetical protein
VAVFVGPFACLQSAFQVNLRALLEVLLDDLAQALVEDYHTVPLGFFLALTGGLVAPAFRGGHPQIRDRAAVLGAANFRIRTEIADEDHLVDATCHDALRVAICGRAPSLPKRRRSPVNGAARRARPRKLTLTLDLGPGAASAFGLHPQGFCSAARVVARSRDKTCSLFVLTGFYYLGN